MAKHLKPDPELYLAPDKVTGWQRVETIATIIFMAVVLAVGIVLGG